MAAVERGWLWSDVVLSLGMIGTVVGFMVMLSGFAGADFSNVENTQGLIAKLSYGMSTALATTLVGLISSVLLKLQFFMLEAIIRKEDETDLPF
jgi:biopolymer transport protein ExbB/TolQ